MFLANIKFLIAVRYVPTKIAIICYVGILKKSSEISGHAAVHTFTPHEHYVLIVTSPGVHKEVVFNLWTHSIPWWYRVLPYHHTCFYLSWYRTLHHGLEWYDDFRYFKKQNKTGTSWLWSTFYVLMWNTTRQGKLCQGNFWSCAKTIPEIWKPTDRTPSRQWC